MKVFTFLCSILLFFSTSLAQEPHQYEQFVLKTVLQTEGFKWFTWAGDDAIGRQAATGVYFVKMVTDEYQSQHKIIFVP